jgi:tRNA (adenine57-N1/adenine58-N1)-methyltransferase
MDKPDFHLPPIFKKLKRGGPAVILPKDSGAIIAYTGINKDSIVVEAGAGSGFLTVALAGIAKEVISYENDERFAKLAEENIAIAGLRNVKLKQQDVTLGMEEKNVDCVVLDMRDAASVLEHAHAALKKNGYCVAYLPNADQAKDFAISAQKLFSEVFMMETIVRDYEVRELGVRPKHFGLMHTAYLIFARK